MSDAFLLKLENILNIHRHSGELDKSLQTRLLWSALGYSCLKIASGDVALSKSYVTRYLNELLITFNNLYKNDFFTENVDLKIIRQVYENTGYLLNNDNHLLIAKYGRGLNCGNKFLYFGLQENFSMRGLGIYTDNCIYEDNIYNIMIRDELNINDLINSEFINCKYQSQRPNGELEFFSPIYNVKISSSWIHTSNTRYTICRTTEGCYYKVLKDDHGELKFALMFNDGEDFLGHEYRRLYYALKNYYNCPIRCNIEKIDNKYCRFRLNSKLPNREQNILLLLAWPVDNIEQMNEYIAVNENIGIIKLMFQNLGMECREISLNEQ